MKQVSSFLYLLLAATIAGAQSYGVGAPPAAAPNPITLPDRIRGVTLNLEYTTPEIVHRAANYGANFICLSIHVNRGLINNKNPEYFPTARDPFIPYSKALNALDSVLPVCRKENLRVRVGIVPWGRNQDFAWEKESSNIDFTSHLYEFWESFARRYKSEPAIVMYTIVLEPNGEMLGTWQDEILPECAKRIRRINPYIWLGVMPGPWGMPKGFATLKPINDPYAIYCFHPYSPHSYLHQGVFKGGDRLRAADEVGQKYPGMLKMHPGSPLIIWDRKQLENYIGPAVRFAGQHGVRIFADEFGVVRWAPGGEIWTEDMISVLEKNGIDWCAFNLCGWNGFNPTFGPEEPRSTEPFGGKETGVLRIWKKYWALNGEMSGHNSGSSTTP